VSEALQVKKSGDLEVVIARTFDAPRTLVFDAFTKPELVKRWLLGPPGWSMPVCDIDLKVGGRFRWVWRNEESGKDMGVSGTFREILPPERIVHDELFDEDWTGGQTIVTTQFSEASGRTLVTMTVHYSSAAAREAALGTGMTRGMEQSYQRLDEIFAATPVSRRAQSAA
jgi:uncharacterized protein YndB with AHSA1/START domain